MSLRLATELRACGWEPVNASAARATESARRPRVAPFAGAGHGGVARPPLGRVSNPFATSLANTRQKARRSSFGCDHYSKNSFITPKSPVSWWITTLRVPPQPSRSFLTVFHWPNLSEL